MPKSLEGAKNHKVEQGEGSTLNGAALLQDAHKEKKQPNALVNFGTSLGYELVEARVDGLLQFFDHSGETKLGLFAPPEQEQFGTAGWYGQQLGGAAGTAISFLLLKKVAGLGAAREAEVRLASIFGEKLRHSLTSAAVTGALYQGVFTPSSGSTSTLGFTGDRLQHAGIGAVTFATLAGSARGLSHLGTSHNLPLLKNSIVNSALSGLPAGFVSTELATGGKASGREVAESMFTYALIGGVFGGVNSLKHLATRRPPAQLNTLEQSNVALSEQLAISNKPVQSHDVRLVATPETRVGKIQMLAPEAAIAKVTDVVPLSQMVRELKGFPDAHTFKKQLGGRSLGTLPPELSSTGLTQAEAFSKLDALARMLRSVDCNLPSVKKQGLGAVDLALPEFKIQLGETAVGVKKIGMGETATVYRLSADGKDFAFKVVHDPARIDVHGSHSEAGALTFLSQYQIRDLNRFHASNPGGSGGWVLNDFVTKPVIQPGVELKTILKQNGLQLGDDWSANRGPGGIIWDVGGIEPISVGYPKTLHAFRDLLNSEQGRMIAGRRMNMIEPTEAKEALLLALAYPEVSGQVPRSAARILHDKGELAEVLHKALKTPGAAGRAAFELDYLKGTPHIRDLYYEALKNPESRIEAAKQIDQLAPQDRMQAFEAAFKYPECRPMAARAVASLPNATDRAAARQMAEKDSGAQIALALQDAWKGLEHRLSNNYISDWLVKYYNDAP